MANRATEKMLAFARDIAAELDMELPTTTDADGETVLGAQVATMR